MGRAIAVDWSGAVSQAVQRSTIWVAEAIDGVLVALSAGRTRDETVALLCDESEPMIVGLDFGFSFPAWWLASQGVTTGPEAWALAAAQGEGWLTACPSPFWGRAGSRRPTGVEIYRRTEQGLRGVTSVFQIGGAGAVGTGSIRGMPGLATLAGAGFTIWPFDDWATDRPVVAEVWPRMAMGSVVKSSAVARAAWVTSWPEVERWREVVVSSPDAFDAACAARWLSTGSWPPPIDLDSVDRLEGRVLA